MNARDLNKTDDDDQEYVGSRWNVRRILDNMSWFSFMFGVVLGGLAVFVLTLAVMLIIMPYLKETDLGSLTGGQSDMDLWTSYGEWEWSDCSTTCGSGSQRGQRSRTCVRPNYCIGNETEIMVRPCILQPCKVDGQWTDWKPQGPCSVTCGQGVQTQRRICANPVPSGGGKFCEGDSIKQIPCNTTDCCPGKSVTRTLRCEGGWIRNDDFGACYCFSNSVASWHDANRFCKAQVSVLADIYSRAEANWLYGHVRKQNVGNGAWIGAKLVGRQYKWMSMTGSIPIMFKDWAPGEPKVWSDNGFDCVWLWATHNFQWDDYLCTKQQKFICKGILN